jgi:hypothetical protein
MTTNDTDDAKAIRLLKRQLEELEIVRALDYKDSKFKVWQDATTSGLKRFLARIRPT